MDAFQAIFPVRDMALHYHIDTSYPALLRFDTNAFLCYTYGETKKLTIKICKKMP
jgi:hypothetical protein